MHFDDNLKLPTCCWVSVTFYPQAFSLSDCLDHYVPCLTHWGRDKMAAVSQTMFSNAFSWMKIYEFCLKFHWSLFRRFQLTIFQHWFRYWLGAVQATSHYLNQWWLIYWRIYASLGFNELKDLMIQIATGMKFTNGCYWSPYALLWNSPQMNATVPYWW